MNAKDLTPKYDEVDTPTRNWYCPACKVSLRTLPTKSVPTHRHGKNTDQIPFHPNDQED